MPNTWAQVARSIGAWLDWCELTEVDWRHASQDDLTAYRNAYLGAISPVTGQPYSPNTIRVRMIYALEFVEYAAANGWYEGDLATGSPDGSRARRLLPKESQDDTVRVLRLDELQALIRWVGPRPSQRAVDDRSGCNRDRIVIDLGWAVGLRVAEILTLQVYPFQSVVPEPDYLHKMFDFFVIGKGNKRRAVEVPAWLVLDIQAYISGERQRTLQKRGPKAKEGQLILNSEHSRSRPGHPTTISALDALMERACVAAGLVATVERINPETGEVSRVARPRHSMHSLRHTYAVLTYNAMRRSGVDDLARWKHIQMQLGHKSPQTTIEIYLKYVHLFQESRASTNLLEALG